MSTHTADATRARRDGSGVVRLAVWVTLGIAILQATWIVTIPPFRAMDEVDHAFRAAGVARGDLAPTTQVADGRGPLTRVPADLVAAAYPQCSYLFYVGTLNCRAQPGSQRADGTVLVATSAGRYNPLLYWVMGTTARPFHGAAALYAMRVVDALLCLGLLFLSVLALARVSRGRWTVIGLLAALTPTVLYSTSAAAPNGLEMMLGLSVWCSALALLLARGLTRRTETGLLVQLAASTGVLFFLRDLGPVWVAGILLTCAVFAGRDAVVDLWRRRRRVLGWLLVAVVLGGLVLLAWRQADRGLTPSPFDARTAGVDARTSYAFQWLLWTLQMVAAIPFRDQPAPLWVYPVVLVVMGVLLVTGLRRGRAHERLAIVGVVVVVLAVPTVLTLATLHEYGAIWQGRYGIPLAIGILPLCGTVLDRVGWAPVEGRRLQVIAMLGLLVVPLVTAVTVVRREAHHPSSAGDPSWHQPAPALVALLVVLGWSALVVGVRGCTQPVTQDTGQPVTQRRSAQSRPRENADSRSTRE